MENSRTKENWLTEAVTELEREFAAEGLPRVALQQNAAPSVNVGRRLLVVTAQQK